MRTRTCSARLAGDLKITEVVDAPNWMVGCFMPDAVFTDEED